MTGVVSIFGFPYTASVSYPDGTVTGTVLTLNPSMTQTTAPNGSGIALRGLSVAPNILASNTQNYTGATGVVGITVGATIQAGAAGTLTAWNGQTISLTNGAPTTLMVQNAYGITVNNFGGTNGYTYVVGGYFKDQTNGATGNAALLVGGSGVPAIAGNFSLYNQSSLPSIFLGTLGTAAQTITSASATALSIGLTGATNPAFQVDASTASQVAGLKITGAATGGTVALVTTDSGSNTNLTINAKGSGTIGIGSVSTGVVTITPNLVLGGNLLATLVRGGSASSSVLTLESTSGTGTTDSIVLKTGSQVTALTVDTNQKVTVASGKVFQIGNAATTGLTAGVLAALTNATIVITDSTGQAYRIPCII